MEEVLGQALGGFTCDPRRGVGVGSEEARKAGLRCSPLSFLAEATRFVRERPAGLPTEFLRAEV